MSTAIQSESQAVLQPDAPTAPKAEPSSESRFVFYGITWKKYVEFLDWLDDRPTRVTYSRGTMEVMSPSPKHEMRRSFLGRMVGMLLFEQGRDHAGGGSTTFKREDLDRGLEPDECFWLASEAHVRGLSEWNPAIDPPPELVIEVEVSRSVLNRLDIFAALGVPELWRVQDQRIVILVLDNGQYRESPTSPAFPGVPVMRFFEFLAKAATAGELVALRAFVAWIRAGYPDEEVRGQ